jgi:O-antigen ligase
MDKNAESYQKKEKKENLLLKLIRDSVIIHFLIFLSDSIYKSISESFIAEILTERGKKTDTLSVGEYLWDKMRLYKLTRPLKKFFMRGFERSSLLNFTMRKLRGMLDVTLSSYGMFLLSFGIYTVIVYFVSVYAFNLDETPRLNLYTGIILAAASFFILPVKESLAAKLNESRIMSFLLFSVLGIRRGHVRGVGAVGTKNGAAFVIGMLFGLAGYFVEPYLLCAGIIALIAAVLVMMIPEIGVLMIIFTVPFIPTMFAAALTLFVAFCYFLKLIRGKRVIKFEFIDITVLIFMTLELLGGIFSVSRAASLRPALLYVCFMSGYFITVNLIRSSEWVKRCVYAFAFSAFAVAVYGIYENYFGPALSIWHDENMFESITTRVVSTFENPNVLAEYLIMTLPFLIALVIVEKKIASKLMASVICGSLGLCLIFTWARGAWLGILFALLIFFLIYHRRTIIVLLMGILALPLAPFILPSAVIQRFLSIGSIQDTSTAYRVNIWIASVDMIRDFFSSGIGVGTGAFAVVYPNYSLAGIESAPHSHNLYLQIIIEIGIFGLFVFLAVMIYLMRSNFMIFKKVGNDKKNKEYMRLKLTAAAGFCAVIAMLVQGLTDYVWYNYRIFFVFWLVVGLTVSVRRTLTDEWTEYEDKEPHIDLLIHSDLNKKRKRSRKTWRYQTQIKKSGD